MSALSIGFVITESLADALAAVSVFPCDQGNQVDHRLGLAQSVSAKPHPLPMDRGSVVRGEGEQRSDDLTVGHVGIFHVERCCIDILASDDPVTNG